MKPSALRRRIAPFTKLSLALAEPGNSQVAIELKLAFNMNAGAAIQEQTGLMLTDLSIWKHIAEPKVLRAMLWAAVLAHQPEYDCEEGLYTIGSFIQEDNAEQIIEALDQTYLAYLPKAKREWLEKLKAEADRKSGESSAEKNAPTPATSGQSAGSSSGPSEDTTSASAIASSAS
jgi:hypothetical protein